MSNHARRRQAGRQTGKQTRHPHGLRPQGGAYIELWESDHDPGALAVHAEWAGPHGIGAGLAAVLREMADEVEAVGGDDGRRSAPVHEEWHHPAT